MKIKEIAFTIYAVSDMKKAKEFYEGLLGLVPGTEFNTDGWTEYDIAGGTFALGCWPDNWKPSPDGAAVAFEVEDFNGAIEELKKAGVQFKIEPSDYPTCQMAVAKDPDGNHVCIHQRKNK